MTHQSKQNSVDALCKAIKAGEESEVKKLLADPAAEYFVNETSTDGYTPLYLACCRQDEKQAQHFAVSLMKLKAKVDLKGEDRETPLYIATHNHLPTVVKYLLSVGANVNEMNGGTGDSALHAAARFGFADIAEILVAGNANINCRNTRMETPLLQACKAGRHNTTYFLLLKDANKSLPNDDGKNPLFVASENDNKGCVLMLKSEKQYLKDAKAHADAEARTELPNLNDPDVIAARVSKAKKADEEAKRKEEQEEANRKHEIIKIDAPEAKERTHDPLTGKALPPEWKSVVGATPAPVIPAGVVKPIPEQNYGGTSRKIGTGTGQKFAEPEQLVDGAIPDANVVFDTHNVAAPKGKQWQKNF